MANLEYEFPIGFRATPVKHRTPKFVSGKFIETFDVEEIGPDQVNPLMDLTTESEVQRYFEIEGRFFKLAGEIDGPDVKARYSAARSPIKAVGEEYHELRSRADKKARASGLALFPKLDLVVGPADAILKREWFSEIDLDWLDRLRLDMVGELSELRCCEGMLYEPMPEPAFIVNMRTENRTIASIHLQMETTDQRLFLWGYPVAYFNMAQQDEAIEYAKQLAALHGVRLDPFERKDILVHDQDRLTFEPFHAHAMEACTLAYRVLSGSKPDANPSGLAETLAEMESILGEEGDGWRTEPNSGELQSKAAKAERLAREARDHLATMKNFPVVLIDSLLDRWDERPVTLPLASRCGPTP